VSASSWNISFGEILKLRPVVYYADQLVHGQAPSSLVGYLRSSTFWFESLQNWQSEFLSLAVMIVLSVFLRQRGSPESKPVHHPYGETGRE